METRRMHFSNVQLTTQSGRQKLKTSQYENTKSVLPEWFRQKQAINTPIQGAVL
jgi:hypothetical protein